MNNGEKIWLVNNTVRGELNFKDYKFFIIPTLCLKYLEDHTNRFQVPQEAKLSTIIKEPGLLKEKLHNALKLIEELNPFLQGVFYVYRYKEINDQILFKALLEVQSIDTKDKEFGRVMDELMDWIYHGEGRGGEGIFTPSNINKLGIRILNPISGTLYDGSPGVGGTLREGEKHANQYDSHLELYGQEYDYNAWALGKLLFLLSGKDDVQFVQGDTLTEPAFVEGSRVKQFDHVMMDFPLSLRAEKYEILEQDTYHRFTYGIPPKTSADMAFVLHALASTKETGRAVVIVSNGTLFRSGTEKTIRKNMIAADVIEAVIALPENMFEGVGIQTNFLVLNKQKPENRKGKILFINAEDEFQEVKKRKRYFSEENIEKIMGAFIGEQTIEKFSKLVNNEDIKDADLLYKRYLEEDEIYIEPFGKVKFNREAFKQIPDEKKSLATMSSIYRGMNVTSRVKESEGAGYRIIKLSDVQNGEVLIDQLTSYSITNNARIDSYKVREGDVIVSSRGTSIKIAVIPKHEGDILLSSNFLGIRLGKNLDPHYLKGYLESPVGQFLLASKQIGTAVATLNPNDLKEIKVPVLSAEQQQTIGKALVEAKQSYEQMIKAAEEERKRASWRLYEDMGIGDTFELL
ncbi:N-6 DNA methylase [Priestia aryabhattai]|uniref:N-6 DNA methylase n=1 Tax=Priestia aryabhattai TaxID=412384 RepID=UPI00210C01A2|nr:N-6 DNA methylase [Priestia aryabhattai]